MQRVGFPLLDYFNTDNKYRALFLPVVSLGSGEALNITSPNYLSSYSNNVYGMWDVSVPEGFVISIALEILDIANDFIYYGDGVGRFSLDNDSCSRWKIIDNTFSNSTNFTSISSSVILIFTSAGSKTGDGFLIGLKAIRLDDRPIHKTGRDIMTLCSKL